MKTVLAIMLLAVTCSAQCRTTFSVIREDTLGNIDQGLASKDADWAHRLEKKYPDVCYAGASADATVTFFISVKPAVYQGTRTVNNTHTDTVPVSGTITDQDGNSATISGTQQVTSTTSSEVPYSVNYGIYTLYVQHRGPDGKFAVLRTFQQEGLYAVGSLLWGGGRGKHPEHAVLEDAVKWVASGGISSQVSFDTP